MANEAKIVLSAVDQTKAAIDSAKKNLTGLGDQAAALSTKFGTIGTAIAAAFAGASLKGAIDTLDKLDDMAEKTGIATDALSALRYAGEVNSVSFESLAVGIKKLSKNMAEAAGGSKDAAATYAAMGIEVKDSNGKLKSSDEVLGLIADRFKNYEDGAAKAALAQQIFGKSGADMIPLLNLGAEGIRNLRTEAEQLGAVYGGDLAKQAADFNDNLKRMQLAAEAAKVSFLGDTGLLQTLVNFTNELLAGRKAFGSYLGALYELGIKTSPFDNWSDGAKKAADDVAKLTAEVAKLQGGQRGVGKNAGGAAFVGPSGSGRSSSRLAAAQAELATAQKRKKYFDSLIYDSVAGEADRLANAGYKSAAPVADRTKETAPNNNAEKYISSLAKEMATLTKTTSKYDEVMEHIRINAKDFSPVQKAEALAKATEIDVEKRLGETIKNNVKYHVDEANAYAAQRDLVNEFVTSSNDATAAIIRQTSRIGLNTEELARLDAQEQVDVLMKKLMANATSETRQELETLAQTMRGNVATAMDAQIAKQKELTDNMVNGIQKAIKDYSDELKHVGTAAGQATTRILQSTEDALTQFFTTGKLNARSLIDTIIAEFMRLQVVRPLMASLFGSGGMLSPGMMGGALNDLKMSMNGGFGTGSSFGNLDLGGFLASGGSANGGTPYIVGERGPELFIPNSSGTVVPNNKMAGGASIVNTYNVNIDSRSDAASVYAGVRQMLAQHSRQQRDDLERMGVIAA